MISIRLRIFLLASVTLFAVTSAFFVEYRDIQEKLNLTEYTLHTSIDVRALSDLIHPLQKERGLTAGYLIGHDEIQHGLLLKQRELTDSRWKELSITEHVHDLTFSQNITAQLAEIRQRVDSGDVQWDEAKAFYSSINQRLLDLIILKVASMDYSQDISYELQAIAYLAISRENLGLIRATIYRGYQQKRLSTEELADLSHYYGIFIDNLRIYDAISTDHYKKTSDSSWLSEIQTEVFQSVITQINNTLKADREMLLTPSMIWWREATLVVDDMKKAEDAIFDQIEHHVTEHNTHYAEYLYRYGIFAVIVFAATLLLTVFTVYRILKALSVLIHSLENVEKNQDFGLRIQSKTDDEFGKISYSINSLLTYTDKLIKEKEFLATIDLLTGVMNRRSFIAAAEKEIKRSERYGTHLSMIFCDIDLFKSINDQHGHAIGDEVLKTFAKSFMDNVRSSDYVGRWGGEEFIVLAPETDLASAGMLAEKLRQKIMALSINSVKQVTCSFGVAQKMESELFSAICDRADQALYQAKNSGRNKVCFSE